MDTHNGDDLSSLGQYDIGNGNIIYIENANNFIKRKGEETFMKKKALALLMATAMVASLAGCGSKEETTTADSTATTENAATDDAATEDVATEDVAAEDTAAEEEAAAEEEEAITATITVWGPSEDQSADMGNWLPTMCEQFAAEHPNWTLTFEYGVCAEGDAKATVTQDPTAAADVYMFANDNITDLIASNGIAKLGGETAEYVKSTNSAAIVDSVSVDGDIYGVPFTTNTWFMYYDKSVFSEDDIKNLDTMLEKGYRSF